MLDFFNRRYLQRKTTDNPLWLIVLSDIMTNLMLFFLILYVFSIQPKGEHQNMFMEGFDREHVKKMKEQKAEKVVQKFTEEDVARKLAEELRKSGMDKMAEIQMTEKQIRINISAPVLFASGSASLSPSSSMVLGSVAGILNRLPNEVVVEGHTDSVPVRSGDYATNWELSSARSTAVADFLTGKYGVSNSRIICAAYGEYRPVASNDTSQGRALNRRIEIIVSRK